MRIGPTLTALGCALALAQFAPAQETYPLSEVTQSGQCFQTALEMKLSGEIRVQQEGTQKPLKLEATAAHAFTERVLHIAETGLPDKVVRHYDAARAAITCAGEKSERSLRPERKLLVAQWHKDSALLYCPAGALRRDELELTSEHFDTLNLAGLLPGKAVAVGDTWKVTAGVVQGLCRFEGLTEHALEGKLDGVKDGVATVTVTGKAAGIDVGALVTLTIQATAKFDLTAKRVTEVTWTQKDDRSQGPVSPASAVELTTRVVRKAVDTPKELDDTATVSVPDGFAPPASATMIDHVEPGGRFAVYHTRDWVMVGQTDTHTVFRAIDRGDFLAQATVAAWKPAEKGKHLSPEDFKDAMNRIPGWDPVTELQSGEVPAEGKYVYRYSVQGKLDGLEVLQNFFLVAGPGGEQVVVTVTMTPKQVEKLGARDLALVGSMEVPAKK